MPTHSPNCRNFEKKVKPSNLEKRKKCQAKAKKKEKEKVAIFDFFSPL